MDVILITAIYFGVINLSGFIMMGIDKRKAIKQVWRTPESSLFLVAILGGSLGSLIGMYSFRHKTQKKTFKYGMPFILFLQLLVVFLLVNSSLEFFIL